MGDIALFYFVAQVIERFLELIDWIASFFLPSKGEQGEIAKRGKMIAMWFLACLFGLIFAWRFQLYMMNRLGVSIEIWKDMLFTAVLLGSGTKPIHDIISLMGKHKK